MTATGSSTATPYTPCDNTMTDSGANVCLTHNTSILVNIVDIPAIPLGVAVTQTDVTPSLCTKQGFLPIPLLDGTYHYQPFLVNDYATDTILSPIHIMKCSDKIRAWSQSGSKDNPTLNNLVFTGRDGQPLLLLPLTSFNGLQYCSHTSTPVVCSTITYPHDNPDSGSSGAHSPHGIRRVFDTELWSARLGYSGNWQLREIPKHTSGSPAKFYPHPLRFVDHKEQARIRKKAAGCNPEHAPLPGQRFGMDFGFIRASASDYSSPDATKDWVVESFDGYVAYLIIVDDATKYVWIFLRKSKTPPTDLVSHFLQMYGRKSGGVIRCDQGGELARSHQFRSEMMKKHLYVVEPTGADSPSQNGMTEHWNDTLAVTTRALLYGAALPAKYWSAAFTHAAYIHNRRVHSGLNSNPYEHWYGHKSCLKNLRVFGSPVCVKRTGHRRAKLDKHDFNGIFIVYTATDSNIQYIDCASGLVKASHTVRMPPRTMMTLTWSNLYLLTSLHQDLLQPPYHSPLDHHRIASRMTSRSRPPHTTTLINIHCQILSILTSPPSTPYPAHAVMQLRSSIMISLNAMSNRPTSRHTVLAIVSKRCSLTTAQQRSYILQLVCSWIHATTE